MLVLNSTVHFCKDDCVFLLCLSLKLNLGHHMLKWPQCNAFKITFKGQTSKEKEEVEDKDDYNFFF